MIFVCLGSRIFNLSQLKTFQVFTDWIQRKPTNLRCKGHNTPVHTMLHDTEHRNSGKSCHHCTNIMAYLDGVILSLIDECRMLLVNEIDPFRAGMELKNFITDILNKMFLIHSRRYALSTTIYTAQSFSRFHPCRRT